jgi:transcriptional regulator with XRE-family HTH domain
MIATISNTRTVDSTTMTVGRKIAHLLLDADMSAAQLARVVGVSGAAVSRWVSGENNMRLEEARRVAIAFGVSLDWLSDPDADYPPLAQPRPIGGAVLDPPPMREVSPARDAAPPARPTASRPRKGR